MEAAFVAVGSELLGTRSLDTNSLRVTGLLRRHGVILRRKAVVGDDEGELALEIRSLLGRVSLAVISGGLGPTADDVTRQAVADACGVGLEEDPEVLAELEGKFRALGRPMPAVNRRQALILGGSRVLPNPRGTAPGLCLEHRGTTLFLLPGVPRELEGLLEHQLEPWLSEHGDGEGIETAVVKVACLPESEVEERVAPAYDELGRERISVLTSPGEVRVELSARGAPGPRRRELERMMERIEELVGMAAYGRGAEVTLEGVVGDLLRQRSETVATGESCTGGLLAQRFTGVAGSSDYFSGGVVAYSDAIKVRLLGVSSTDLSRHGAVSEPIARALALGARRSLGSDWGIGITGVAGPGGGSEGKPVGTVHVAVSGPGSAESHRHVRFPGERRQIRWLSSQLALELLRRQLIDEEGSS